MSTIWNERYSEDGFAYGTIPNDFLVEVASALPEKTGKVLMLADGEGRNGVYMASLGFEVTSVDLSTVGLEKTQKLATERGTKITTIHADLTEFAMGSTHWDAIVSIFAHFPAELRKIIHGRIAPALKPGGRLILEGYTPANVGRGVGGPPTVASAFSAEMLKEDFSDLSIVRCEEKEREIQEGRYHNGWSAVVQLVAEKG